MSPNGQTTREGIKGKFYDSLNRRLVFIGKKGGSGDFWDTHWNCNDLAQSVRRCRDPFVVGITQRYLHAGSRVLEGGCGRGDKVYALLQHGFDAYGIDFAKETTKEIRRVLPELNIRFGDVRTLPFEDGSFDGYWSLGVIEHFYGGYGPIVGEMYRVLRPGGYVFLTVPTMSPFRRFKAKLRMYPDYVETEASRELFYQFALHPEGVRLFFESSGFDFIQQRNGSWFKGFKDEVTILKPFLQRLYDGTSILPRIIKRIVISPLESPLSPLFGHIAFFVFKKQDLSEE